MEIKDHRIDKSKEAFLMAIEINNKPTIPYRLEGFSFFICNVWELMLKAFIINKNGLQAIYYPDRPNRTHSYSRQATEFIVNEIKQDPEEIFDKINKKSCPREQRILRSTSLLLFRKPAFILHKSA